MKNLEIWKKFIDLSNYFDQYKQGELEQIISDADKIIEFRSNLRIKINELSDVCKDNLGVKVAYFLIFPVVVYCDEVISLCFAKNNISWPKMQKEIYGIENGGEKFYELLDQIIEQPTYPEIVYQVYYWLLAAGFQGVLIDETKKSAVYYNNKLKDLLRTYYKPEQVKLDQCKLLKTEKISTFELFKVYLFKYAILPLIGMLIMFFFLINIIILLFLR